MRNREQREGRSGERCPCQQRRARAEAPRDSAGVDAKDHHPDRRRQQVQAGDDDRGAEAEAGAPRQLRELGEDDEGRVHPGAQQERGEVRSPHAPNAHHRHVDERIAAARLDHDPDDARRPDRPRSARASWSIPSPMSVVSLTASSTVEMPIVIRAAASQLMRPATRTGDSGMNRQVAAAASTDRDERDPEEPVIVEVLDDDAGEHDADARRRRRGSPRAARCFPRPCRVGTRRGRSRTRAGRCRRWPPG